MEPIYIYIYTHTHTHTHTWLHLSARVILPVKRGVYRFSKFLLPIWEHCALWLYDYIYLKQYIKYTFKSSTKFWNILLFPIWKHCPSYRCIILFGHSSSRYNTMLSFRCLPAFWRKILGRKNKETVNEEGCDVGCVYHFTMLVPLHW